MGFLYPARRLRLENLCLDCQVFGGSKAKGMFPRSLDVHQRALTPGECDALPSIFLDPRSRTDA
jgi:hypothetical protein